MTGGRPTVLDHGLDTAWMEHAECKGCDPELMFPQRGDMQTLRLAKATCAECPVRGECLDYALAIPERNGVWGGLSERERLRLRRHRGALTSSTAARVTAILEEGPMTTRDVASRLGMTAGYAQDILRTLTIDGTVIRTENKRASNVFQLAPDRAGGTEPDG